MTTQRKKKPTRWSVSFFGNLNLRHGSVTCTGLLGYNLSDPQQAAEAKKNKVVMARCPAFVRDAVKLVEKVV